MAYKFLKISNIYPDLLSKYYWNNKQYIKNSNYYDLKANLFKLEFSSSNNFAKNFIKIGVEADEIIYNAKFLQYKWASEKGLKFKSYFDILVNQIIDYKPDVLYIQNTTNFTKKEIQYIRESVKSIQLLLGNICAPFDKESLHYFNEYDLFFTCIPNMNYYLNKNGVNSHLFYHAFEPTLFNRIQKNNFKMEKNIAFLGSIISKNNFHNKRREYLIKLIDDGFDIDIFTNTNQKKLKILLNKYYYYFQEIMKYFNINMPWNIKEKPSVDNFLNYLKNFANKPLYGLKMYRKQYQYKIGLNIHAEVAGDYAGNIRMFEVTGVGSCLVTDDKKNITELFEPDYEIVTYRTKEEASEKCKWLLNHPKELKRIAENGQRRTFKDHTYYKRVLQLDEIINNTLKRN